MDQFTYAERATDWRGNNSIAESMFEQVSHERHRCHAVVTGAGTGGTSATIGRFIRYQGGYALCVVDRNSVFLDYFEHGDPNVTSAKGSGVEGIGRPRVEPSFVPEVVDRMLRVPNAASYAGVRFLEQHLGRKYGGSTGTCVYGAMQLAAELVAAGEHGAIMMIAGDPGERLDTYYNDAWLAENGHDIAPYLSQLATAYETGGWPSLESGTST